MSSLPVVNADSLLISGLRKFFNRTGHESDGSAAKQLIEGQMADARHVNEQANELKAQYEDALKQAHEESAQIVEKARKSAQAEYESRMDAADTEAQKIIANAHKSIDLEREKTVQELQSQIAGLAMAATAKVLGDTDQAAQNKLMYEQFLAKTGGLNDTNSK